MNASQGAEPSEGFRRFPGDDGNPTESGITSMSHPTHRALSEVGWLRQLALSIVRDAHEADDAVQDAWVKALQGRAEEARDPRAWWGTVLRRAWNTKRRDADRRRAREADVARTESQSDTTEMVQRVQEHRLLLELVESLEEPYRTTVLLRFFEDLPPRRIAERMDAPVATVHTRLKRALEMLRQKLERRHGSRDAWLAALAPIAVVPHIRPASPWMQIVGMKTSTKLVVASVGILACIGGFALSRQTEQAPTAAVARASTPRDASPARSDEALTRTATTHEERVPAAQPLAPAVATGTTTAVVPRLVNGRLLDPEARPLSGLLVAQQGSESRAHVRADAQGRFQLELTDAAVLVVAEAGWTTVLYGSATGGETEERVVVAARRLAIDGDVVDAEEAPVADAGLGVQLPDGFRERFPGLLDYSGTAQWSTATDRSGAFHLHDLPGLEGLVIEAQHHLHARARHVLHDPAGERITGLRIRLGARPRLPDDLVGTVVDERGLPLENASVAAGEGTDTTNAAGEFRIHRVAVGSARVVRAVKAGFQPVDVELPALSERAWIVLRERSLSITGRVENESGAPVVNAKVWVADPTFFGFAKHVGMDATVEGLAAGELTRGDYERNLAQQDSITDLLDYRTHVGPLAFWNFARTDADGRFELRGLSRREYALRAMDVRTLQMVETKSVAAGSTGVVLRMSATELWPLLRGHVVGPDGRGVAGVRIAVSTTVLAVPVNAATTTYRGESRGDEAVTDEKGGFELRDVPANAALGVMGDHVQYLEFGNVRSPGLRALVGDTPDAVTITVAYRYHFRVDTTPRADLADEARVLDADGREMRLERLEGYGTYDATKIPIRDGTSGSWNVAAGARTVVLLEAGAEVARFPVRLDPLVENVLRP